MPIPERHTCTALPSVAPHSALSFRVGSCRRPLAGGRDRGLELGCVQPLLTPPPSRYPGDARVGPPSPRCRWPISDRSRPPPRLRLIDLALGLVLALLAVLLAPGLAIVLIKILYPPHHRSVRVVGSLKGAPDMTQLAGASDRRTFLKQGLLAAGGLALGSGRHGRARAHSRRAPNILVIVV